MGEANKVSEVNEVSERERERDPFSKVYKA